MWDRLPGPICCTLKPVVRWLRAREDAEVKHTPKLRKFFRYVKKYRPRVVCFAGLAPEVTEGLAEVDPSIVTVYLRHGIGMKIFENDRAFWDRFNRPPAHLRILLTGGRRDREYFRELASEHVRRVPDAWLKFDRFVLGKTAKWGAELAPGRPTAIWAPTVGRWSSVSCWTEPLLGFFARSEYNLIVKPHSLLYEQRPDFIEAVRLRTGPRLVLISPEDANILPIFERADVLLTDLSSAAGEFFYFQKPIVYLMHAGTAESELFYAETGELAYPGDDIGEAMDLAFANTGAREPARREWADAIWGRIDGRAGDRAAAAVIEEVEG